jgi:Predicted transcriptional regulators
MICENIKELRELRGLTQTDLAKKLGLTRSSVNAWEMGISIPSTQYIIELANLFKVSTDYIFGLTPELTINIGHLSEEEKTMIFALMKILDKKRAPQ